MKIKTKLKKYLSNIIFYLAFGVLMGGLINFIVQGGFDDVCAKETLNFLDKYGIDKEDEHGFRYNIKIMMDYEE